MYPFAALPGDTFVERRSINNLFSSFSFCRILFPRLHKCLPSVNLHVGKTELRLVRPPSSFRPVCLACVAHHVVVQQNGAEAGEGRIGKTETPFNARQKPRPALGSEALELQECMQVSLAPPLFRSRPIYHRIFPSASSVPPSPPSPL